MSKATELRELASLTTANTSSIAFDADVYIGGDLITTGNTINVVADTLNITDPNITLASGAANSAVANGAGITIDGAGATLTYNSSSDAWGLNKNLGVNTNTPDVPLDVRANTTTADPIATFRQLGSGDASIRLQTTTSPYGFIFGVDGSDSDKFKIAPGTSDVGSGTAFTINTSGYVGVGESTPASILHVQKNQSSVAHALTLENSAGGDNSEFDINFKMASSGTSAKIGVVRTNNPGAGDTEMYFSTSTNGASPVEAMVISHEQRIGINGASRGARLMVSHDTGDNSTADSATLALYDSGTPGANTGPSLVFSYDWNNNNGYLDGAPFIKGYKLNNNSSDYHTGLKFGVREYGDTVARTALTIDPYKKVGVNTETPVHTLDVEGSIGASQVRHSIRPTLNLDFTNNQKLDHRVNFYRNSIGTYYDSKGSIKIASANEPRFDYNPLTGESKGLLIEEARTNQSYYTSQLEKWTYTGYGVLTQFGDYYKTPFDGICVRSMIFSDPTSTQSRRGANQVSSVAGRAYTTSFYIKNITNGNQVAFYLGAASTPFNGLLGASFDFANEQWSSSLDNNSQTIDYGSEKLKDGWYRVWITATAYTSDTWNPVFVGNNFQEIAVFGMQVEEGYVASSHIPSYDCFNTRSTKASYVDENGELKLASINEPRYNYIWDDNRFIPSGLLVETSSTNNFAYSNDFSVGNWTSANIDETKVYDVVDPYGEYDGVWKAVGNGVAAGYYLQNTSLTTNVYYTTSVYVKAGNVSAFQIAPSTGFGSNHLNYDLSNGTLGSAGLTQNQFGGIEKLGNGWYRCWLTCVATSTSGRMAFGPVNSTSAGRLATGTLNSGEYVYMFGAQMESNSVSSYIPTTSSTVSRSADVVTSVGRTRSTEVAYINGKDFKEFYNQDQGTILFEAMVPTDDDDALNGFTAGVTAETHPVDHDGSSSFIGLGVNIGYGTSSGNASSINWYVQDRSVSGDEAFGNAGTGAISKNNPFKVAMGIDQDNVSGYLDGTQIGSTDTSVDVPMRGIDDMNMLILGGANSLRTDTSYRRHGHLRKFAYYPERLSNAELQALTENN
jgi:hypothetical protein